MIQSDGAPPVPSEKQFCVVYRCESRLIIEAGKSYPLPEIAVGTGRMTFVVSSQYAATLGGNTAHAHLVLYTRFSASTMREANTATHIGATTIALLLAFVHNAYIEPPFRWFSYEAGSSMDWRRIGQMEPETISPRGLHNGRTFHHELMCRFIVGFFGAGLSGEDLHQLLRSIGLYGQVLESWTQAHSVFAAQYLFMAAEPLAEMAIPEYERLVGKTKEELLRAFFDEERGKPVAIPECASPQEAKAISKLIKRVEGIAKVSADRRLKNAVRKNTIFQDAPDAYDGLKDAIDGMEHGNHPFPDTVRLVLPLLDRASKCVRSWICKRAVNDPATVTGLLTGDWSTPLVLTEVEMVVDAEFKSQVIDPTRGPYMPPFKLTPRLHRDTQSISFDIEPTVLPSVEWRVVSSHMRRPEPTFAAESKAHSAVLENLYGFKASDLDWRD